jgi:hypothetical protein
MAEILNQDQMTPNLRNAKYPWHEWFDGQLRRLEYGTDYPVATPSFVRAMYAAAKTRGVRTELRTFDGYVLLRAVVRDAPADRA